MDHMRISGSEPSSESFRQSKWFQKLKMLYRKYQKQAEAKRDGVINPQNYNFNQFVYGQFWCIQVHKFIKIKKKSYNKIILLKQFIFAIVFS